MSGPMIARVGPMSTGANESGEVKDLVILDQRDPFERALIGMVETYRRKRRDYGRDSEQWSNFVGTARFAGFTRLWESALFNCVQKLERIASLRANGRLNDPANEAVEDTLLDNAVYAVIAYAIALDEKEHLDA